MPEVEVKQRLPSPRPLAEFLPRVPPHAARLVGAVACLLLSVAIALAFPQIVRRLLDAAFISGNGALLAATGSGWLKKPMEQLHQGQSTLIMASAEHGAACQSRGGDRP